MTNINIYGPNNEKSIDVRPGQENAVAALLKRSSSKNISNDDFQLLNQHIAGGSREVLNTLATINTEQTFQIIVKRLDNIGALSQDDKSFLNENLGIDLNSLPEIDYYSLKTKFTTYPEEETFFATALDHFHMNLHDATDILFDSLHKGVDPFAALTGGGAIGNYSPSDLKKFLSPPDEIGFEFQPTSLNFINQQGFGNTSINEKQLSDSVDFAFMRFASKGDDFTYSLRGVIGEFLTYNYLSNIPQIQNLSQVDLNFHQFGDGGTDFTGQINGKNVKLQVKTSDTYQLNVSGSEIKKNDLFISVIMQPDNLTINNIFKKHHITPQDLETNPIVKASFINELKGLNFNVTLSVITKENIVSGYNFDLSNLYNGSSFRLDYGKIQAKPVESSINQHQPIFDFSSY